MYLKIFKGHNFHFLQLIKLFVLLLLFFVTELFGEKQDFMLNLYLIFYAYYVYYLRNQILVRICYPQILKIKYKYLFS